MKVGVLLLSTALSTLSGACGLKAGMTYDQVYGEVIAVNQVAAVVQALITYVGLRYYWAKKTRLFLPGLLVAILIAHPGLYVAFHRDWLNTGDCGTSTVGWAGLCLLSGLVTLSLMLPSSPKTGHRSKGG